MVMTGERMSSLYDPIEIVRNVVKELTTVGGVKAFENLANPRNQRTSESPSSARCLCNVNDLAPKPGPN